MQKIVSINAPLQRIKTPRKSFLFFKRLTDILFALVLSVLLFPAMVIIAIASAVDTKSNPFFLQTRVGKDGKYFRCLKFRTMSKDAPANVATCDMEARKYISPIGHFLRNSSLDELPQFWNILKGDMSFVGPRPIIPAEKELIRLRKLHYAESVRPGLTGWSQINGRDNLRVAKKAFMDGYYARHACLAFDIKILYRTVFCVLKSENVVDGHTIREADIQALLNRTA